MLIGIPKDTIPFETRMAITPNNTLKYLDLGAQVLVEPEIGRNLKCDDSEFHACGATIVTDNKSILEKADIILRLQLISTEQLKHCKSGGIHISFFEPFKHKEIVDYCLEKKITLISMELMPRITRAQKMDALSSQYNLAGYAAVMLAAHTSQKVLPLMMTAAGTITPARFFVLGAGVAGLQAIATAKRLGASVEAFDIRPAAAEQIKSLGAKSVKIHLGDTNETKGGYAKKLTPQQLDLQQEQLTNIIANSDIVITTAQVFGKPAPKLITETMLDRMKMDSVIVDMAVSSGGNVEGSVIGETIEKHGVTIVGHPNLAGTVALDASLMYANNLYNLIENFWNKETKQMEINLEDEILKSCIVTHEGKIIND